MAEIFLLLMEDMNTQINTLHTQRKDRRDDADVKKNSLNSDRRRQITYHSDGDSRKTPVGNHLSASGPRKNISQE